jgi:hypothetical protein
MAFILTAALSGCGGDIPDPLQDIVNRLKKISTASVILNDMRTEGTFSNSYYHKYQVVLEQQKADGKPELRRGLSQWLPISEKLYKERESYLGMTVYSKKDGKENWAVMPPGYDFVGDTRYGRWERDRSGNQVWHFLAGYAALSYLTGNRPIYGRDYSRYQQERARGRGGVWYGPKTRTGGQSFGTNGTVTRNQKPDFYQRRMARQTGSKSSFSNKVQNRVGRTSTGLRSRSGGLGK